MRIDFKINQREIESFVDPAWRSQIPFVIHQTIKQTMFEHRKVQQKAMDRLIDGGPVGFTKRGIRYRVGSKRNLAGQVYFTEATSRYMRLIIDGGQEKASDNNHKKLNRPVDLRLTKHGNIPNKYINKKASDSKFFFGIPKGKTGEKYRGVWRRMGKTGYTKAGKSRGKIRLKVSWALGDRRQKPTYPAREIFRRHVGKYFNALLPKTLEEVVRREVSRRSRRTGF
jgi:hypothetical protein